MKEKNLHIRIDEQTLAEMKQAAEKENRSISNYILNLFKEAQKKSEKTDSEN